MPSALDVYDALMGKIDLDLVSVSIPHLRQKYRGEVPEERAARFKRYQESFSKFDDAFLDWNADMQLAVSALRHFSLTSAEAKSREEEANVLKSLESQITSA